MEVTRRAVLAASASAPFIMGAGAATGPQTTIKIDTGRTRGAIDRKVFGNFIEHLGRCIDGGVFQEGSPLSDSEGFRKDVLAAAKKLDVSLLRWPGGNFSSNYDWMDGIGPRDRRPRRLEMAWGTVETNRFGTHEFLDYVAKLGAEPYICTNLGTGTWTMAQRWVEYVNCDQDTAITRLRRKNGREKPWKVKYWGLGNEMDGPWQMGHRDADDYGKFAREAAKLMRLTDPDIKLIAAGAANFRPGSDWVTWNRTILEYLKDYADYISLHLYVGNPENDFGEFLASSMELDQRIETLSGVIDAAMAGRTDGRKMYIALDEWNVWYRARGPKQRGRDILEEHYNLEDALVVATFLNSIVNHADVVKIGNLAQMVNVIAPIFTNDRGLYLQTIYYPLQLFASNVRGDSLKLEVNAPSYKSKHFDSVPYVDASGSLDGNTLVVNLVNRHLDQPMSVALGLENRSFAGPVAVSVVNGPSNKSENDFGKTLVKTATDSLTASGNALNCSLAPHSYTQLKATLA
ncbi:MAG: alpha-N-arabinofuranosidase [Alphaproteobacteria bacterium]|nr:alpha-N-arabinofuranosidase [Alphaproteobacteria bacterium]